MTTESGSRLGTDAPTVDTTVNFWPSYIDMLTSVLMFFLLMYFVERYFSPESLAAIIAQQKRAPFVEAFEHAFAAEREKGTIGLDTDINLVRITFGDGILFKIEKSDLTAQGRRLLARLAKVFLDLHAANLAAGQSTPPYDEIRIEGHTDSSPMKSPTYPHDNWELSTARAQEVRQFLTGAFTPHLDDQLMSVNGYEATQPVSEDPALNRRIEIRIYFSGTLPDTGRASR
jgi:flagellar motor protein MotB